MEENKLYKILITGHVQGVGYRWRATAEARILGIKGLVKNLSDGNVYIEAEGTVQQLDNFVAWCKKGPGHGFVESVDIEVFPAVKNYTEFRIEY